MPTRRTLAPALSLLLCAACQTGAASPSSSGDPAAPPRAAAAGAAQGALEKVGIVAPLSYDALVLVPEQYAGGFSVLEVLPHGTLVSEGDVIARLDARAIDQELHRSGLELASAEIRHQGVVERNRLDAAAAALELEQSAAALERARRSLAGFREFELAFDRRADDLAKRNEQASIEDQVDELDQLEKMYKADALVDATEDIVIKRSRRQLETTRQAVDLSRDRARYREEYDRQRDLAQREDALRAQAEAHGRLARTQELDARARADAEVRSADALREQRELCARLQRDRALFELRAPRAGVLLHGASRDFRPGRSPARCEKLGSLAPRTEVFLVADPEPGAVTLDLSDADLAQARSGLRVRVESLGATAVTAEGTLVVETHPLSASASEATYSARVTLDAPLAGVVHGTRARVVPAGGKADG